MGNSELEGRSWPPQSSQSPKFPPPPVQQPSQGPGSFAGMQSWGSGMFRAQDAQGGQTNAPSFAGMQGWGAGGGQSAPGGPPLTGGPVTPPVAVPMPQMPGSMPRRMGPITPPVN